MRIIFQKFGERILYGFGFGFGMGISFKIKHNLDGIYKKNFYDK